jgi:hypothetical protein
MPQTNGVQDKGTSIDEVLSPYNTVIQVNVDKYGLKSTIQ